MKTTLLSIFTALALCHAANAQTTTDSTRWLFRDGDGHNAPYRIPAITAAKNGDVVALCDRRYCGADIGFGHVNIVGRISTDNGHSWGDEFVVMKGSGVKGAHDCGYGDAALVADRQSNTLLLMAASGNVTYWDSTVQNPLRMARSYAHYDKRQRKWLWTAPEDVTDYFYTQLFGNEIPKMFFGSGRICQSRQVKTGKYYRLYAALATSKGNFVVYSDDFGQTWAVLGDAHTSCASNGNEPKCEELPDGSVLLSSRKRHGRFFNIFTYKDIKSATGNWGEAVESDKLAGGIRFGGNATDGEILLVRAQRVADKKRLTLALQSIPTADERADIKIYYKALENKADDYATPALFASNWEGSFQVTPEKAAYSTMTLQADGNIGFYMETNPAGGNYDMLYLPINLETLTGGTYKISKK